MRAQTAPYFFREAFAEVVLNSALHIATERFLDSVIIWEHCIATVRIRKDKYIIISAFFYIPVSCL